MKKKSLYDIAMEKKQGQNIENNNIIISQKKSILLNILLIIGKFLKLVLYIVITILITIGMTVLINKEFRDFFVDIIGQIC